MNYNEFYLHFYYSTNFTSVPFNCTVEKNVQIIFFQHNYPKHLSHFRNEFFIAVLENIYIETKRSSNEIIFWEDRENGEMEGEYCMVRTGPCFHSLFLENSSIYTVR